ncbi:MAG: AraC family transcriptional regulator [Bacteroidota bacterium]
MKYLPSCPQLMRYIDHYWIESQAQQLFSTDQLLYAYPGITPELILILDGYYRCKYKGKWETVHESRLYSFLEQEIILDTSSLSAFVIVQFKSHALAALLPFLRHKAEQIMAAPICSLTDVWGAHVLHVCKALQQAEPQEQVAILDDWLSTLLNTAHSGFITEIVRELGSEYTPATIQALTGYSRSTLERYFKKDTGLTPKRYQSLQRYKAAVQEIYLTKNTDWQYYVNKYGYFDQSHFIKEIKRYTTFTPSQLLRTPGILSFRPQPTNS